MLIALVMALGLVADELPQRKNLKSVIVNGGYSSRDVSVKIELVLPSGQKVNSMAPSRAVFYHKSPEGKWAELESMDLKPSIVDEIAGRFRFHRQIRLPSESLGFAMDATVFHCQREKGPCYIDHFQKVFEKKERGHSNLSIRMFPEIHH